MIIEIHAPGVFCMCVYNIVEPFLNRLSSWVFIENMAENRKKFNFQNACLRDWTGHFCWNSTKHNLYRVLPNDAVTASGLFCDDEILTYEHGHKSSSPTTENWRKWQFSKTIIFEIESSASAVTTSVRSTLVYFSLVQLLLEWVIHHRAHAFWKS